MRFKNKKHESVWRKGMMRMGWMGLKCLAKIGRASCRVPKIGKVSSPTGPFNTGTRKQIRNSTSWVVTETVP